MHIPVPPRVGQISHSAPGWLALECSVRGPVAAYWQAADGVSWSVDATAWPFVICYQRGRLSDQEFRASHEAASAALESADRPYVLLMDSQAADLSATQRRELQLAAKRTAARRLRLCRGIGIVASSTLTRGCLSALLWLFRPNVPTRAFADRPTAQAWLRERLLGIPPRADEPGHPLGASQRPRR